MKKRLMQRILAFMLATTIPLSLSGCSEEDFTYLESETISSTTDVPESTTVLTTMSQEEYQRMLENEALRKKYVSYFSTCAGTYNYEELYPTYEAILAEIAAYENSKVECSYKFDGNINAIVDKIVESSKNYDIDEFEKHNDGIIDRDCYINHEQEIRQLLYETIKKIIEQDPEQDYEEDLHNISELKFFYGTLSVALGMHFGEENTVIVDLDKLYKKAKDSEPEDINIAFQKEIKETTEHEFNHVRQYFCSCKNNQEKMMFKEKFIIEASAESQLYNQDNTEKETLKSSEHTYPTQRGYESLLFLLGMFHGGDINDYYNAIFNNDLNLFYKFCGVSSDEDKVAIQKIIYSISSMNLENNEFMKNFANKYEETEDKITISIDCSYSEWEKLVGHNFLNEIFRFVLRDMVNYTIDHPEFSLKDNIFLYSYIRNIISFEGRYIEEFTDENGEPDFDTTYSQEFLKYFLLLDYHYQDFLKMYYNVSDSELSQSFKEILFFYEDKYDLYNLSYSTYEEILSSEDHKELFKQFPLLVPIIYVNDYVSSSNYKFLKDDAQEMVLTKKVN